MKKRGLIAVNGLLWASASFNILRKGMHAIVMDHRLPVVLVAIAIGAGFFMMFRKVSLRYCERIMKLQGERFPLYMFMSTKGYMLIGLMMSMGIAFNHIPAIPTVFFAGFYPGLGFGLLSGAIRFLVCAVRQESY